MGDSGLGGSGPVGAEAELRVDCLAVYEWLVRHGDVPLDGVATALGLSVARFGRAVDELVTLRLVQAARDRYAAVPPQLAASLYAGSREAELHARSNEIRRELAELASAREGIGAFASTYYQARARQSGGALQVLDESGDVQALLNAATAECRSEVMACQPGGKRPPSVLNKALPRDLALLNRGIRLRSIYQRTAQFDGPTIDYAMAATAAGSQIRIASELPSRMIIFDREIAVLPHHERPGGAIVIREPSTVLTVCNIYEFIWGISVPYTSGPGAVGGTGSNGVSDAEGEDEGESALSDLDLRILQLLADGLTDAAIGARLGMSDRAVRKHASQIYQHLGAKSRFQAGAIAGRLGIITHR